MTYGISPGAALILFYVVVLGLIAWMVAEIARGYDDEDGQQ
jgi:hypothetical protein